MMPYQQRVVDEHRELAERLEKLAAFLVTNTFADLPDVERSLLEAQSAHMRAYLTVLEVRIQGFTSAA